MVIYFDKHFGVNLEDASCFNPILDKDVKLFIDPFLVKKSDETIIADSYQNSFIKFFQIVLESMAIDSQRNFKKYKHILKFPEVSNLCLGFSQSTKGAGMGFGFSRVWYESFNNLLSVLGNKGFDIKGIEVLSFITNGIDKDRLSDLTANLIKKELIRYTQKICNQKGIKLEKVRICNYEFDYEDLEWEDKVVKLPINPTTHEGIILVPEDILRIDPTLTLSNFKHYLLANCSDDLKRKFNLKLLKDIDKKKIYSILKSDPDLYKDYYEKSKDVKKSYYDTKKDEDFLIKIHEAENVFSKELEKYKDTNIDIEENFIDLINEICNSFKHSIEEQDLYKSLWVELKPREEKHCQSIFQSSAKLFCKHKDIDLTRESNSGRGPVDFKFSRGSMKKVLVEIKYIHTSALLHKTENQLVQYLKSEDCKVGIFITISYFDSDMEKINQINEVITKVNSFGVVDITHINIDARNTNKISASKIKEPVLK